MGTMVKKFLSFRYQKAATVGRYSERSEIGSSAEDHKEKSRVQIFWWSLKNPCMNP